MGTSEAYFKYEKRIKVEIIVILNCMACIYVLYIYYLLCHKGDVCVMKETFARTFRFKLIRDSSAEKYTEFSSTFSAS